MLFLKAITGTNTTTATTFQIHIHVLISIHQYGKAQLLSSYLVVFIRTERHNFVPPWPSLQSHDLAISVTIINQASSCSKNEDRGSP
mmetsp:Transcript_22004/g.47955  ORF Transcript_22004/g.47955 Transcript_22004/m.47955 type:complete len:87 (-) Transcript_22004:651-911(-)